MVVSILDYYEKVGGGLIDIEPSKSPLKGLIAPKSLKNQNGVRVWLPNPLAIFLQFDGLLN